MVGAHAPRGATITVDLFDGTNTVLRGIADGVETPSVPAGDGYTIVNVTGGNYLSAYFEIGVTSRPPPS